MDLELTNKIALVTGSSRGLGFATAKLLSQEGARVTVNSRTQAHATQAAEEIQRASGSPVIGLCGDLADPAVPEILVQQTVDTWGGLDILITNAGGPPSGAFETFDDAAWQNAIEISFLSHVRLIRAALPYLRQSAAPSVLTITSYSVKQPIPNLVLSNSIRAATVGLTKTLALELGKENIRFNSIMPAWTETERIAELMQARAAANSTTVAEEMEKQARSAALGRASTPEEFARPAVFFVSPAASYITGVMLTVDGGLYKGTF